MKNKQDKYWREKLSQEEYHVLRERGTEPPGTGKYLDNFAPGMYKCIACGQPLFSSETKFHSDCGWPSFDKAIKGNVEFKEDRSYGMIRTEVVCNNCGSHLGHVFDDGPEETTGLRYCINSVALSFQKKD